MILHLPAEVGERDVVAGGAGDGVPGELARPGVAQAVYSAVHSGHYSGQYTAVPGGAGQTVAGLVQGVSLHPGQAGGRGHPVW